MRRLLGVLLILILVILGIYLYQRNMPSMSGKMPVSASFYPLYFFTSQVGGDKASVTNITPSGVEPHDYEPTPQEVTNILKSKMLVINGVGFEPWFLGIKNDVANSNVKIVTTTEGLPLKKGLDEDGKTQVMDPHVWLSPKLAQQEVANIEKGYIAVDPSNAAYYQSEGRALTQKLKDLDTQYKKGLANCEHRSFVTSHAAFGYLARDYGLTQIAIAGISPEQEPSASTLAEIVDLVKNQGIKVIFFEELVSPKLSETVARETGAKTTVLSPIEGLSNEEKAKGDTYFTVMRENLHNLREALVCK